jgi:hypothetical protein
MLRRADSQKFKDVSGVLTAYIIALMMEAMRS